MKKDWHGLLTILEISHIRDGKVIWQDKNLRNLFHTTGEEFMLKALFEGLALPAAYYLGLDNRSAIDVADTMTDLVDEPSVNGYLRQSVDYDGFTVSLNSGVNRALSPIVTFMASGGSWGPVRNLFLTNESDDSGYLIASVPLSASATLNPGDNITMRMGLSLQDCTTC
jgi:hypothetical protein